jgi:hypothetical protein
MLEFQINLLTAWWAAAEAAHARLASDRDRGEVTAQTALIVILVIAAKINNNADAVPEP